MAAPLPDLELEKSLDGVPPVWSPSGPVLIAVDTSEEAAMALEWYVCNLHNPDRMGLVVYHVVDLPPNKILHGRVDVYMGGAEWQQVIDNQKHTAKALEQTYKDKLTQLKVNGRVKTVYYARPGESIVEAAAKEDACLIVMGARGTSTTRRTIIGSVTDYVLKHAHCPVTTYRYSARRRTSLAMCDSPTRHGSFSKLFGRHDKPRSRSNSIEVHGATSAGCRQGTPTPAHAPEAIFLHQRNAKE